MVKYDGVAVEVVVDVTRKDVELRVIEKAAWNNSPDVGSTFWVSKDDTYLMGYSEHD